MDAALAGQGPLFACARTDNQPPAAVTERDAAKIRGRFMDALRQPARGAASGPIK